MMTCSLGNDGVPSTGDTCTVTCNRGYVVNDSEVRTCGSNGMWSGTEAICSRGNKQ